MHDEKKLPKWAQLRIEHLRREVEALQAIKDINIITSDKNRDWFPIRNIVADNEDVNTLWLLYPNKPHALCALAKDDVLFVGRANDPQTED